MIRIRWWRREPLDTAELARLVPAPGDPVLPPDRLCLVEENLMREIQLSNLTTPERQRRRRVMRVGLPAALLALSGGAVAAATVFGAEPSADTHSVRCYSTLDVSAEYASATTTTWTSPGGPSHPGEEISATVAAATNACAGLWKAGLVHGGHPPTMPGEEWTLPPASPGAGTVPPLTACIVDRQAAVFPGNDPNLCQNLGLPRLADRP